MSRAASAVVAFALLLAAPAAAQPPAAGERFYDREIPVTTGRYPAEVAFSPDGKLVAAGAGSVITVWHVADGKKKVHMQLPDADDFIHLAFSADGRTLYSEARYDEMIRSWSVETGKQVREVPQMPGWRDQPWAKAEAKPGQEPRFYTRFVSFGPGGRLAVIRYRQGGSTTDLVDTATGKTVRSLTNPSLHGAAFSPDGKLIAGESERPDGVAVVDAATGKVIRSFTSKDRRGGAFAFTVFSPDSKYLASGGHGVPGLDVFEVATGQLLVRLPGKGGFFTSASFSPDNRLLAATLAGETVLYDLAADKPVQIFQPPTNQGYFVAFSPDGGRLAVVAPSTDQEKGRTFSIYLFEPPAPRRPPSGGRLTDDELAELWKDLPTENVFRFQTVTAAMRGAPASAVPFLEKKVRPVPAAARKEADAAIAALDDEAPEKRDAAQERLLKLGHTFEPLLSEAYQAAPAGEVRNRLGFVLKRTREAPQPGSLVAEVRAVGVLEQIGTPEAKAALEGLAAGAPKARLTEEARAALGRIAAKKP